MIAKGSDTLGRVENSIEIKASPEKVWEMLALDRLPEWQLGFSKVKSVEYTSEVHTPKDKFRAGTSAQGIPKEPEDDYCRFEMKESLENKKIIFLAWEETNLFGRRTLGMFITYFLEPVGTNTKFIYELEAELPLGVFGKFLEKLYFRRWAKKQMQKELENLKNILEKRARY